jgi:hypothetical protein
MVHQNPMCEHVREEPGGKRCLTPFRSIEEGSACDTGNSDWLSVNHWEIVSETTGR